MKAEDRLRALEVRARGLIVEIVPMVKSIPIHTFSGLNEFLNNAIENAKISLSVTKQETERRFRPRVIAERRVR